MREGFAVVADTNRGVYLVGVETGTTRAVITSGLHALVGVAYDPVTHTVYWTEAGQRFIGAAGIGGQSRRTIPLRNGTYTGCYVRLLK